MPNTLPIVCWEPSETAVLVVIDGKTRRMNVTRDGDEFADRDPFFVLGNVIYRVGSCFCYSVGTIAG